LARPPRSQLEKSLVGPTGEYYVLYRLHAMGLLASLAPRGAPTVDILVLSPDETVVATLQVKTRTYGPDGGWHMHQKHESIAQPRCFYAFVDFEPQPPVTYIVPSKVVADVLAKSHQAWLATPGKKGRIRKDGEMRRVRPRYLDPVPGYPDAWLDQYRERWDLLGKATGLPLPPAADSSASRVKE
jgi:hypothetical protein